MSETTTSQLILSEDEAREELRKLAPVLPSAATAIMTNPAAAAKAANPTPPEEMIKRCLDALPGLIGGVDHALRDQTGKNYPFVLLVFAENVALHAANFDPKTAQQAVIELAQRWDTGEDQAVVVPPQEPGTVPTINGHEPPQQPDSDAGASAEPPHVTH